MVALLPNKLIANFIKILDEFSLFYDYYAMCFLTIL